MDQTFRIVRKGYDKSQVDEYIVNLCKSYEKSMASQKERIENLKAEVLQKEKLLQEYIDKKDSITKSITLAVEKAKQIEYAAKVRYALESERLAMFSDKWTRYCESIVTAVDKSLLTTAKEYMEKAGRDIAQGLSDDLNMGTYLGEAAEIYESERGRLARIAR